MNMTVNGNQQPVVEWFSAHGLRMRYGRMGSGPPILFLPGIFISFDAYLPLLMRLSQYGTVYACDLPPFGRCDCIRKVWTYDDYARYFESFLISRGIRTCTVIAHSMGGGVAMALARYSDIPAGLILCNPAGLPYTRRTTFPTLTLTALTVLVHMIKERCIKMPVKLVAGAAAIVARHPGQVPAVYQTITAAIRSTDGSVPGRIPVTVLWGTGDEILNETYLRQFPADSRIKVQTINGNHNWILTHQEEAFNRIRTVWDAESV